MVVIMINLLLSDYFDAAFLILMICSLINKHQELVHSQQHCSLRVPLQKVVETRSTKALLPRPSKHFADTKNMSFPNVGNSCCTIRPFQAPLKISSGLSILPDAVTVMANVARLVSFVDFRTCTVRLPTISRVYLAL